MSSDQDKLAQVAAQTMHQWQNTSVEMAWVILGGLLMVTVLGGACLAIWIFRGGLSRGTLRG